jgi:pilus assembly protein FimV
VAPPPKAVTPPPPPPSAGQEWYQNNTALLVGGIGLLLIGGLALMRFMRKPRPVLMPTAPLSEADEHAVSEDEHNLLDALAQHPGDPGLSLELLTLYHSHRDAAKFEAAAEAMYAHIADPTQHEWQQVRAMGEDLCPHNPLFGGSEDLAAVAHAHDEHTAFGHHAADGHTHDDSFDLGAHDGHAATLPVDDSFDFDLTDHAAAAAVAPAHETDFGHGATLVGQPTPPPAAAFDPVAAAAKPPEDFFAGEDAIGTKLDLAKAYLDMGDPEGARSMLDEVMAEGSDTQKGEARKLLAEIR